ncbi:N-acetylglucosamine kinase [uncultured Pseudokineococcus sp.]|uniref:N-acetylglucosamine kinase n=1 Tax=uncultured Pseudokineococcus sp. TaxID=1642928 RepID=UPI0026198224|nr:BadF/BadG/BcrA/BcrD ATPase family protein [uncultured Pseudokineococcus sp.]
MRRPLLLAVDAGGTSTRAVVADAGGTCLGYAAGSAGNPTSAGPEAALAAVTGSAATALARAGRGPEEVGAVLVAMAGDRRLLPRADLARGLGYAGEPAQLRTGPDILAMYYSGAVEPTGAAVVAGTGSVAAQVRDGEVARAVGGCGWLVGDGGSGFALGHAVVRAVVAELEGTGPATALTDLLLGSLGLATGPDRGGAVQEGRPRVLQQLMDLCYAERPVALARHAPLALAAPEDPVARHVVARAQEDLARLVVAVRDGAPDAPLVLGGSVLHHGLLAPGRSPAPALASALAGADVRPARDGAVGAAVAALAALGAPGTRVPPEVVERLRETVAEQRAAADAGRGGEAPA